MAYAHLEQKYHKCRVENLGRDVNQCHNNVDHCKVWSLTVYVLPKLLWIYCLSRTTSFISLHIPFLQFMYR